MNIEILETQTKETAIHVKRVQTWLDENHDVYVISSTLTHYEIEGIFYFATQIFYQVEVTD